MTRSKGVRVVLLSGSSLCGNPRVFEAAHAVSRVGCDVQVLGAWFEPDLKARHQSLVEGAPFRFVPVLDCTLPGFPDTAAHIFRRKAANALHGLAGRESMHHLGPSVRSMAVRATAMTADLFIAHSEPAIQVAADLMRRGRRVGADMEDWFSEDLLPEARKRRSLDILRRLERDLLRAGDYTSCTSDAMSEALAGEYGSKPPTVIYNAFPWVERQTGSFAAGEFATQPTLEIEALSVPTILRRLSWARISLLKVDKRAMGKFAHARRRLAA